MKSVFFFLVLLGLGFAGTALAADASFSLRYQEVLALKQVSVTIPNPGAVTITDKDGIVRNVNAQSVLGVLVALDEANPSFALSEIQYYESFDSLIVNCITIAQLGSKKCNNWLYAVNGSAPSVGMDKYILTGGESVFVYFGPSRQVVLSAAGVSTGQAFTATAQNYQYEDNVWGLLSGVTIGITKPDPENPWSPIEVLVQAVDAGGQAVFTVDAPGQYNVGIKEDFYFPSVPLTVSAPSLQFSGGGVPAPVHSMLNAKTAISFLLSFQNKDGSFGATPLLSDWTALALSSYSSPEAERAKDALRNYLVGDPSPGALLTDYERRAMALMALGVNPYFGTPTNYIQKIIDGFDGEQFGDSGLINDDIFALLTLVKAGYQSFDAEIAKPIAFLLGRQENNGSFGSVDMTAAAIQALALVSGAEGIRSSLASARNYLKEQQNDSGGFGNVYATSWVTQAIATLGESEVSWIKGGYTPGDYLYAQQAKDGGVEEEARDSNRVWATSYAIPAALGKSWGSILTAFEKPSAFEKPFVPLSPQEELPVSPVAKENSELAAPTIEAIRQELAFLQREVAVLQKLEQIQRELDRIAFEVKAVQVRVVAFRVQELAQEVGQPGADSLARTQGPAPASRITQAESVPARDLSGITLVPQEETPLFAAEAKEAAGSQGLSPQLIILLVIIGGAVFVFSGGINALTPLLRKTLFKV